MRLDRGCLESISTNKLLDLVKLKEGWRIADIT
jgi:hypothetical protein